MKAKQLADRQALNVDTVRYYTRIGLLTPSTDPNNGYKAYSLADEKRLQFIIQAKSLGFSLQDIEAFIAESKLGHSACPTVREIMKQRIAETQAKIKTMQTTCNKMQNALATWQTLPDCNPTGDHVCHLIEGLIEEESDHV
ncbi:hypothetical protein tinsulaeT_20980 [Thalassotalea insulae]|uniref:HTH merR-type domain-containing protein n=1 Tax=Thalassotalea insulae TaxID=2056778 RepID=A0ABQ6GS25_9GAMM|nr:MerR family DNA-binding protein [Thalassotalea insulae]GLX78758.1 hypothetical protein tinsulaeT_20980 [Thalassotalea insulae]